MVLPFTSQFSFTAIGQRTCLATTAGLPLVGGSTTVARLEDLSVDALAQHCAEELARFRRHALSDPSYCFELFRRALADGSPEALTWIYELYLPQVRSWVYSHIRFAQTQESADFFAHAALSAFYFALRGARFAQFATLPHVLMYLKLCVHTSIAQYVRDHVAPPTVSLQAAGNVEDLAHPEAGIEAAEVWAHICGLLPEARDRMLAHCVFVQGLRPRQILHAYPRYWRHEREVSVALYRIRRTLRTDLYLQRLSGQPVEAPPGHRGDHHATTPTPP